MKPLKEYYGLKKKNKDATMTAKERRIAKTLIDNDARKQDITYLLNIGRDTTLNQARISEAKENLSQATDEELARFEAIQQNWDFKTGINPLYNEEHLMVYRSRKTMLQAVSIFNSPDGIFNLETFLLLNNIAWLYLIQCFCRKENISYMKENSKETQSLEYIINSNKEFKNKQLLSQAMTSNILSLIKIRDAITHNALFSIPDKLLKNLQSNILNYNKILKKVWGVRAGLENIFPIALQFAKFSNEQMSSFITSGVEKNIIKTITDFEKELDKEIIDNEEYALTISVAFINEKKSDAQAIRFITTESKDFNRVKEILIKEVDEDYKYQYRPKDIIKKLKEDIPELSSKITMYVFLAYIDDYKKIRNNTKKVSNNKKYTKYYPRTSDWGYTEELYEVLKDDLKNNLLADIIKAKQKSKK